MTVVAGYFCGKMYKEVPSLKELPGEAGEEIALNAALNSKVGWRVWGVAAGSSRLAAAVGSPMPRSSSPAPACLPSSLTAAPPACLLALPPLQAFLVEEEEGKVEFVGNRTECALLMMVRAWGLSYSELRELNHTKIVGERVGGVGRLLCGVLRCIYPLLEVWWWCCWVVGGGAAAHNLQCRGAAKGSRGARQCVEVA